MRFKLPTNLCSIRLRPIALAITVTVGLACAPVQTSSDPVEPISGPDQTAPRHGVGALAPGEPTTAVAVEADDGRIGSAEAPVTIVAFLDFQCAFCAQGFSTLESLQKQYGPEQVRIVFKHLPLEFHELALPAAIAGQAVMQGAGPEAFFRFARAAFDNQIEISFINLGQWAEEAGLAREDYNTLVQERETVQRVAQDARLAHRLGVDATPAFFVNGRLVAGAQPIEYFQQVVDEEAAAMKKGKGWKASYQARVTENMRGSVLSALLAADPEDYLVPVGNSPVRGPSDAPVTIVMFTDFECPYCKRAEITLGLLRNKYGKKLRFVFKHMPLPFHRSARPAALLTEAVHDKHGDAAFFQFADAVFEQSPDLTPAMLRQLAEAHGLDKAEIDAAFSESDSKLSERLQEDRDLAEDVQARGTPHFFINGKRLDGARPVEQFEALIDHGLRRAKELRDEGIEARDVYAKLQERAHSPGVPDKIGEPIPSAGRPIRGPAGAPITIHTFSDFECPYCRKGERLLDELEELYPGKLRVIWHDFPLDFHDRARPAAQAAREAFAQAGSDGFWKMHRLLFGLDAEGPALSEAEILAHASALDMDQGRLKGAIETSAHNPGIGEDVDLGLSLGIRGTPAYVVAGYLVTGAKPRRHFERLIERELEEQQSKTKESPKTN